MSSTAESVNHLISLLMLKIKIIVLPKFYFTVNHKHSTTTATVTVNNNFKWKTLFISLLKFHSAAKKIYILNHMFSR